MCDSCSIHVPGPGEVAGGVLGLAAGAAMSRPGRRVLFWGFCVPLLPFAVWAELGWWTIALAAVLAAAAAAGAAYMLVIGRHVLVQAPASLRAALPATGRRAALPRNLAIGRARRALPAPAKALPEAVVTGRVVPAPAHGKV